MFLNEMERGICGSLPMSDPAQAGLAQGPRFSKLIRAGKAMQPGDEDVGQHGNYPLPKCRQPCPNCCLGTCRYRMIIID